MNVLRLYAKFYESCEYGIYTAMFRLYGKNMASIDVRIERNGKIRLNSYSLNPPPPIADKRVLKERRQDLARELRSWHRIQLTDAQVAAICLMAHDIQAQFDAEEYLPF